VPGDAMLAVGTRSSSLRQSRLAQPVDAMLEVLRVLIEEKNRFPAFNCETGVDPQHFSGFCPRLLKLAGLRIGGRQHEVGRLRIGQARSMFAQPPHRLPIALEHVMGHSHEVKRRRLKRIEADV
jgi:hypothetical protein